MAVNVNNLDQTIAVYRASLITLRDDHTRLGQLICGDSLTTCLTIHLVHPRSTPGTEDSTDSVVRIFIRNKQFEVIRLICLNP